MSADTLRTGIFNFKDGGGNADNRHAALEWLARFNLDALLIQELSGDEARVQEVRDTLGMRGVVARGGATRHHTGVFLGEAFGDFTVYPHAYNFHIPPADVTTFFRDVPDVPITFVSVHSAYHNPPRRLAEAFELTRKAEKVEEGVGSALVYGGDWNELPVQDGETLPPIDWNAVKRKTHRRHRTRRVNGKWVPITDVDELLRDCGLSDPARYVAHTLGKPEALAGTAGHMRPDQGGEVRLDRLLIPDWMIEVVIDFQVHKTKFSDHCLAWMDVSRTGLTELLDRRVSGSRPA